MEKNLDAHSTSHIVWGSGTRLWPLSRRAYPKQFLPLAGKSSLFQQAVQRVADGGGWAAPLIMADEMYRFIVAEQLAEIEADAAAIVLEPAPRNTAPAVLTAALLAARDSEETGEDPLLLILPSDHVIGDDAAFRNDVMRAASAARNGHVVTFGVRPERIETGYGHILTAQDDDGSDALPVQAFFEKPDEESARELLADGNCYWNAGIFLASAGTWLALFRAHAADLIGPCEAALAGAREDLGFLRLAAKPWRALRDISVDHTVMEKAENVYCRPLNVGWSDLGSYQALWEHLERDARGNATVGDVVALETRDCILHGADGRLLAVLGVEDIVAITTHDAVLVVSREKAAEVGRLVEVLQRERPREATFHVRVHRPWGWFEGLAKGPRHQVKRLMIRPGARLSLQRHFHRAEHWVVVQGTARVIRGDEEHLLTANDSIHLPIGAPHRIENPGKAPLVVIEVQTGSYLEEDDIERLDDDYARSLCE